ncbi:hypothetical protein Tco_0626340 [Tanacetum coccineum]|uniref:Uncharacterized protein n=1 Tax=Tanacetum coccineum TaxID=301880 RepID=A0ABQ4WJA4_9ASTR
MALPPRDQRYQYLRYEGLQYTDADIADCKTRLARIYRRDVHRVQVFDFGGLPDLMAEGLSGRMLMEHMDAQGQSVFTSRAWRFGEAVLDLDTVGALQFQLGGARRRLTWRQFILALGLHTAEEMETFGFASSYTSIRDLILRLYHRLIACSIARRSQAPEKVLEIVFFGEEEMGDDIWRSMKIDDTWAWVAPRPERQLDAAAGAPGAAEDAFAVDKEEDVHEIRRALVEQREVINAMARDFSRFIVWVAGGIAQLLDSTRASYTPYSDTHIPYQRRVRRKTDSASTSAAQQDPLLILSPVHLYYSYHDVPKHKTSYLVMYILWYDDFDLFMHDRIKPGSKFSTVVREYVTEPCRLSKSRVELRRESVYKSVKAKEKSNLKTS